MRSSRQITKLAKLTGMVDQQHGVNYLEGSKVRKKLKSVLKTIAHGQSPNNGVIKGTAPGYWMISTYQQDPVESAGDWGAFQDSESKHQFETWLNRGGRSEGLRPTPEMDGLSEWVAMWLVDAKTGNWCLGINFPGSDGTDIRRFQLVEHDLARNPQRLLKQLTRRRKAQDLNLRSFKCLLKWAPCLLVMPDASAITAEHGRHDNWWQPAKKAFNGSGQTHFRLAPLELGCQ
jgi:hypothetical protein